MIPQRSPTAISCCIYRDIIHSIIQNIYQGIINNRGVSSIMGWMRQQQSKGLVPSRLVSKLFVGKLFVLVMALLLSFSPLPLLSDQNQVAIAAPSIPPPSFTATIDPAVATNYVYQTLAANRRAYTETIAERAQRLEQTSQPQGVLNLSVRQDWERQDGLPIPCDLLRLGRAFADEDGQFTYGLISPWALDDNHGIEDEWAKTAWKYIQQTAQPYRDYRTIKGRLHFTAYYPDRAVSQACLDCHNRNPEHRSRYPNKTFQFGDTMGALWIDIPLQETSE